MGLRAERMRSGEAWLLLVITCLAHVTMMSACPAGCLCYPKGDGLIVTCDRQNFTEVPVAIPSNTEELILMRNQIETLSATQFSGLTMLKDLRMTNCGIEHIEPNAFAELTALVSMDISQNSIKELQGQTFRGLAKLKTLSIDNTMLGSIRDFAFSGLNLTELSLENNEHLVQISSRAFYSSKVQNVYIYGANLNSDSILALRPLTTSMRELHLDRNQQALSIAGDVFQGFTFRKLKLSYNRIRDPHFLTFTSAADLSLEGNPLGSIDFGKYPKMAETSVLRLGNTGFSEVKPSYFSEMSNLRSLYLSNNGITYIPEKIMENFPNIQRLDLEGNPLHCNCEMLWLRTRLSEASEVSIIGATCNTPKQGALLDIAEDEYACTAPVFVDVTRSVNVSETSQVSLNCTARGDPAPTVIWELPGGLTESTLPPANTSINLNKGVYRIRRIVMANAGVYRCLAINSVGNTTADARVHVHRHTGSPDSSAPGSILLSPLTLITCALIILLFTGRV